MALLGLIRTIETTPGLQLIATETDGAGAMASIEAGRPDVAVIDARLDGADGRDIARMVRAEQLDTRVLLLSEHHTGELILQYLTAGAHGFLSKRDSPEAVREAILQVARGDSVLPDHLGPEVARVLTQRGELDDFAPSARELEVLGHISQGETAAVIAQLLGVSTPTVKSHIQNLYTKLGVNDRGAAVAVGLRRGIIS